ncbi:MAG: glycosyltransferase family 39 protein [Candidatus Microsaccharimonas sp.]
MKKFLNKSINFARKHPKLDIILVLTGLAAFITITLFNVTNAAIWFDEAFSSYLIQFSYMDIARFTATDVHPPLYYWALKTWTLLFGTGEFGLRSMSIFFAAAAIVVTFFLTRRLFGRKVATVTLFFLALSPMLIRYSDEARMYTMTAFIVVSATYLLIKAVETKQRKFWVWYGVFVALGMWTHYFTALVWLSHWAWRLWATHSKDISFKTWIKRFFSKDWLIAYAVAITIFMPWLYSMVKQLGVVQAGGFWIGPVGVDTATNYATNIFYYLEHGEVQSWIALLLLVVVVLVIVLIPKVYKGLSKSSKSMFVLISSIAWVPPILLFLASLPPLRPSFVDRYLIPSTVAFFIFLAIVLVLGTKKWRPILRALPILIIAGMMIFGITNVYKYGNYNKNTNVHIVTRNVIQEIQRAGQPGEPIIATSPWIFYEAVPYTTEEHPVYFIDANTEYIYGSLDMLKYNDIHKIKDLDAFAKANPIIWYLGQADSGDIAPYKDSWQKLQTITYLDPLTGKESYRATQYRISAE